ncbi:MAG: site-specific integrase [Nanoarchaeota archaeon]
MEERQIGGDVKAKYAAVLKRLADGTNEFKVAKNKELTLSFLRDAEVGKTVLNGQKKRIRERRLFRMYYLLKRMDALWFQKAFDEVTEKEMEDFILDLERGIIHTYKGTPYTSESLATIKKFIRKFYKWLLGNGEEYPRMVRFIDTSRHIPEIRAISKEEVDKLIAYSSKIEHKLALAFLFDSGARVQELYNIKIGDLKKEGETYKVRIRISKTRPRTINVPLYTEFIDDYLAQHPDKGNSDAYFITIKPSSLSKFLRRIGLRVLSKKLWPHIMRHSSATYYSKYVSRYQLCHRYGWAASSTMPDRYIDMQGYVDDEVLEKVQKTEVSKVQTENSELKTSMKMMEMRMKEMMERQEELERREEVRKRENHIIGQLSENDVSSTEEELLHFLKQKPNIVKLLREIQANIIE